MLNIEQKIQEHKQKVIEYGYAEKQILGIFVFGSQNYGLATDASDVDTKCIIIPTLHQLAFDTMKPKVLHFDNNEQCTIMTIMHLVDNLKKQNINYTEILFTSYYWLNKKFEPYWYAFFIYQRDRIVYYDMEKCLKSICGQAIHTLKQNPFDGKKIGNGIRLKYFLEQYLNQEKYLDCIIPCDNIKNEILNIKYQILDSDDRAKELIEWFSTVQNLKITTPIDNQKHILRLMERGSVFMIKKLEDFNLIF